MQTTLARIFILSPAKTTGKRAEILFREGASFELARKLHAAEGAVPVGEVFSFLSGLYFRGKQSYASHFARPPENLHGAYVITSSAGLLPLDHPVSMNELRSFSSVSIDTSERRYREPLLRDARALRERMKDGCEVVLLGSIATEKYVKLLLHCFEERLLFPSDFVGRGDMSRGGLLLRCVSSDTELGYIRVSEAESRTGRRPPKLEPFKRREARSQDVG